VLSCIYLVLRKGTTRTVRELCGETEGKMFVDLLSSDVTLAPSLVAWKCRQGRCGGVVEQYLLTN
jgi:hypothetical protein